MSGSWCPGLKRDNTGTLYCPNNPYIEEPDCERCQAERDRWDELWSDCERDEDGPDE